MADNAQPMLRRACLRLPIPGDRDQAVEDPDWPVGLGLRDHCRSVERHWSFANQHERCRRKHMSFIVANKPSIERPNQKQPDRKPERKERPFHKAR